MTHVFMADSGKVALFTEATGGGAYNDFNAPRNAPLKDPANNLDKVYFHSDLDYLEVLSDDTITIAHPLVAAGSVPSGYSSAFGWVSTSYDYLLKTHSLGYRPFALVAQGLNILWPGMPIQEDANGGGRYVSAYVTTTQVRLYEWASIGNADLPAVSIDYRVLVFKQPPVASGSILMDFDPATSITSLGLGKFTSDKRYLQVVSGGTPFGMSYGRTIDLDNGAPRAVRPDVTTFEPVPSGLKGALGTHFSYSSVWGVSMAYGGSFTGVGAIQVQAP